MNLNFFNGLICENRFHKIILTAKNVNLKKQNKTKKHYHLAVDEHYLFGVLGYITSVI